MTDLFDACRWANLALCALLMIVMLFRSAAFLRAPVASRYGRMALFAWISSTGYGTWESMQMHLPPGPRVPTVTSVLLVTAVYVWIEWRYDRRERTRLAELVHDAPAMIRA